MCDDNVDWERKVGGEKKHTVPLRGKFVSVVRF